VAAPTVAVSSKSKTLKKGSRKRSDFLSGRTKALFILSILLVSTIGFSPSQLIQFPDP